MSLADAHMAHTTARQLLDRGIDPGTVDQATKQEARTAPTVKDLATEYLEKWAKVRKRSWEEDERILDKDVIPAWGTRKARDITRRDIITLLDEIVDRGAPIQANRTLAVIRKMFNFAVGRDIVPATPCAAIPAPSAEKQRDRILSADEIKTFWEALDKVTVPDDEDREKVMRMSKGSRLALKLQLATAQRKGEIAEAQWREFDLKAGWWTIPGERSKNTLPHRVPLSPLALALLDQIKAEAKTGTDADEDESPYLFPSPIGDKPITPPSLDRTVRNNQKAFGVGHFTPHDLRRTAASHMASLGVPRLTIGKILNHAEQDITSVYDRHSYDAEKRKAMNTWARHLIEITTGKRAGKVVQLHPLN